MAYFDNNATTPIGQNALQVYKSALANDWSNPSSPYRSASRVRAKLECAREELALDLGVNKEELIFTSGATEANNSIFAHVASNGKKGGRKRCEKESKKMRKRSSGSQVVPSLGKKKCRESVQNEQKDAKRGAAPPI